MTRRCLLLILVYSWNLAQISQQGICMRFTQELVRTAETENPSFPTIFLRNNTSRQKGTSWWWCSWRGLNSCSSIYSEHIDNIFNLLRSISIPTEIRESASLRLYNTTGVDCRKYKKPHNNKKSKALLFGRERGHRAHGVVPLRGFLQACTRTALS